MEAATSFATVFSAIAMPTAIATPTTPKPAATEAAPTIALMPDASVAESAIDGALMPTGPSPSMYAFTSVEMRLNAAAPAPLSAAPTTPPASATDPATTMASIVAASRAVSVRAPPASMLES